ncbi:MAG: hypothetical protein HYW49_04490 [Deltaproteobacteria bacterium]|nr:hypothetical protein [Deltaproteobacteria bacterium]
MIFRGFAFFISVFAFAFANACPALCYVGDQLNLPPQNGYQTLDSEHFRVVYPREFETEARHAVAILERAHEREADFFGYEYHRRITVILSDNEDFANGVTSAIGHQGLVLYLAAPDPYSSIGEYRDWLELLAVHEYAHYLTLDRARGFFQFLRYLFGDLLLPNHFWPGWLAEGLAVYAETELTGLGRGNAAFYRTLTRDSLARAQGPGPRGFLLGFDQLSGPVPDFPFGESAYFAGYAIMAQMAKELGPESLARFSEESSARVPYFLNGTLENITSRLQTRSFRELWASWIDGEAERMKPELEWLRQNGAPDPELLTPAGGGALGARPSPDGTKLAYFYSSGHQRPALNVMDLANRSKPPRKLDDAISGAGLAWSSDGKKIFYSKNDFVGPFDSYNDLFVYDLDRGSATRLTRGARAKDPDLCGENTVVFTSSSGRFSELRALLLDTGENRPLYRAPEYHRVSNPRCSKDGKTIYFSEHGLNPLDAIYKLRLAPGAEPEHLVGGTFRAARGTEEPLRAARGTEEPFRAIFPEPLDDGSLLFTRGQDSFFDLARWDAKTRAISLVARSSGGYWLPRLAGGHLAVTYLSSAGRFAGLADPALLAKDGSKVAIKISAPADTSMPPAAVEARQTSVFVASARYNALASLLPRLWAPYLSINDPQNQFGAAVTGWDDVDSVEYSLLGYYDSVPRRAEGMFSSQFRMGPIRLNPSASSRVTSLFATSSGLKAFSEERKLRVDVSRPFPGAFQSFTPSVLAEWARATFDGDFGREVATPELRTGAALDWDSRQTYAYSLNPETGSHARLEGRRFFSRNARAWKGFAFWNPILSTIPSHSNFSLRAYYAVTPRTEARIPGSIVRVGGRGTPDDLDPPLRGYPLGFLPARQAAVVQSEYQLPLSQIFAGMDTWPVFMHNVGIFGFYDAAKLILFRGTRAGRWSIPVASFGGGMIANTTLGYNVPFRFRLEFARGTNDAFGGEDSLSLLVNI